MSDRFHDDGAGRTVNRRNVLKLGAGALAVVAGCLDDGGRDTESITQPRTSRTLSPGQQRAQEPTTTEASNATRSFEEVYRGSKNKAERPSPLLSRDFENLEGVDLGPEMFKIVINALDRTGYLSYEDDWKKATWTMRGAFVNDLEIGPDRARTGLMRTGGNDTFMIHKFTDEVDGEEIVRKMTGFLPNDEFDSLYIPWQEDRQNGQTAVETYQRRVWEEEDLTMGSAFAIENYRNDVEVNETFEEWVVENDNPERWLSGSRTLSGQNDFIVYEPEWVERSDWGNIGYSREASNVIRDFMDIHDNQDFTPEWEMEETLTEMYHNEVVDDEDTFIHVDVTESGLEDGQRRLTEVDGKIVYAEECDFEQHKKDSYELAIPETFWEEGHRYPGNLEVEDKNSV